MLLTTSASYQTLLLPFGMLPWFRQGKCKEDPFSCKSEVPSGVKPQKGRFLYNKCGAKYIVVALDQHTCGMYPNYVT
jgi:hypothetical protein